MAPVWRLRKSEPNVFFWGWLPKRSVQGSGATCRLVFGLMVKSLNLYPHFVSLQLFVWMPAMSEDISESYWLGSLLGENLPSSLEVVFAFQDTEAGGTMGGVCDGKVGALLKTQGEDGSFFFNWEIQGGRWWGWFTRIIKTMIFCFAPQMMLFLFNEDNKEIAVYRREIQKKMLPNSWCCLPWKGEDGANHLHLYAMKKGDDLRQVQASEDFVNGQQLMQCVQGECYWITQRFRTIIP